ncbi:hypothetical protein GPJ56_007949 [Histomonas meleagridis]|uniref:uncharacterized protein n=1 Tax=Histomonas meleagridis TaxID=135588 RepID=UPI003559D7F2|nr:hypothetical protein GPJ56_007949 [Histomonas meleagridis]KAH0803891.1 hypothetical protein GO595_002721 [Histomonas meleagridis]
MEEGGENETKLDVTPLGELQAVICTDEFFSNPSVMEESLEKGKKDIMALREAIIASNKAYQRQINLLTSRLNNKKQIENNKKTPKRAMPSNLISKGERKMSRQITREKISDDSLDIWCRTKFIFNSIPSEIDLRHMLQKVEVDQSQYTTNHSPWESIFNVIERSYSNAQHISVPDVSQVELEEETFSETNLNLPPFQVEESQKKSSGIFNNLLSALVEADPIPPSDEPREEFLPSPHPLLPKIDCDEYLGYSFDERLRIELIGAGLVPSETLGRNQQIEAEIIEIKKEMENVQSEIAQLGDEIFQNMHKYRAMEAMNNRENLKYKKFLEETKRKRSKR